MAIITFVKEFHNWQSIFPAQIPAFDNYAFENFTTQGRKSWEFGKRRKKEKRKKKKTICFTTHCQDRYSSNCRVNPLKVISQQNCIEKKGNHCLLSNGVFSSMEKRPFWHSFIKESRYQPQGHKLPYKMNWSSWIRNLTADELIFVSLPQELLSVSCNTLFLTPCCFFTLVLHWVLLTSFYQVYDCTAYWR